MVGEGRRGDVGQSVIGKNLSFFPCKLGPTAVPTSQDWVRGWSTKAPSKYEDSEPCGVLGAHLPHQGAEDSVR